VTALGSPRCRDWVTTLSFDGIRQRRALHRATAPSGWRFGVGCGQVLLVERATGDADFQYRSSTRTAAKSNSAATARVVCSLRPRPGSATRTARGNRRRTGCPRL
jgi:hypothetical protein